LKTSCTHFLFFFFCYCNDTTIMSFIIVTKVPKFLVSLSLFFNLLFLCCPITQLLLIKLKITGYVLCYSHSAIDYPLSFLVIYHSVLKFQFVF
jgi:hypothetical protein